MIKLWNKWCNFCKKTWLAQKIINKQRLINRNIEYTRIISEMAIMIAFIFMIIVFCDYLFEVFWPQGGAITCVASIVIIFTLRRGFWVGLFTTWIAQVMAVAVYSFINNPFQFLLDYGLNYSPYVFLIFCRRLLFYENQKYKYYLFIFLCMPLFGLLQLASSIVSGVLFFANYNSGYSSVWVYSFVYNFTIWAPSLVINALVLIFAFYHLEYFTLISRFQLKYLHKIEKKINFYENDHIQNHIACRWIYQKRLTRQNNLKMQFALQFI